MKSYDAQVECIKAYGYNAVESRFLHLVATHSGYFLRRQFVGYTGREWGYCGRQFRNKLIAKCHARPVTIPSESAAFSLYSRSIYKAAGVQRPRPFRDHALSQIETRIEILDFVLRHLDCKYLVSESDKVAYFFAEQNVPAHDLPSREFGRRILAGTAEHFFADGNLIFFAPNALEDILVFTFFQGSSLDLGKFTKHLKSYLPLFHRLRRFDFWFLARHSALSARATDLFQDLVTVSLQANPSSDLLRYFGIRKQWDSGDRESMTAEDLVFRSEMRARFATQRFENLYHAWRRNYLSETEIRNRVGGSDEAHVVRFQAQIVEPVGDTREG